MPSSPSLQPLLTRVLAVSPAVRYAGMVVEGKLYTRQREDVRNASAAETDRYEELFVNPTALLMFQQRGRIDCGGLDYVLVRYGNFFQLLCPLERGHASVCFDPTADVQQLVPALLDILDGC
jgi:hypothetical protein